MSRRKRRNWPFLIAIFAVAGLLLVYAVVGPLISALLTPPRTLLVRPAPVLAAWGERIPIRLFEFFILAWLFVFGSCIGSFLNVVVYRVPRRMSLWGSSHCPRCRVRIPAVDNIPVFGWLKLRARCRTCHLPISARYPLVEFTVGLVVLVLATLEILLAGLNLPEAGQREVLRLSVSWLVGHPRWDLIGACVLHCGLVCVLLSWALIRYDGHAVPVRYAVGAFVAAWLLLVVAPLLRPDSWQPGSWDWSAWHAAWANGSRGILGILGGALVGVLLKVGGRLAGRNRPTHVTPSDSGQAEQSEVGTYVAQPRRVDADVVPGLGLVGICLGWPAAVSVGILATAARLMGALALGVSSRLQPAPLLGYICLAAFGQLCLWRQLNELAAWLGGPAGLPYLVAAATMMLVVTWQASVLERMASTP